MMLGSSQFRDVVIRKITLQMRTHVCFDLVHDVRRHTVADLVRILDFDPNVRFLGTARSVMGEQASKKPRNKEELWNSEQNH
jgi:hypothetical protein